MAALVNSTWRILKLTSLAFSLLQARGAVSFQHQPVGYRVAVRPCCQDKVTVLSLICEDDVGCSMLVPDVPR
jgi:hypothetical protein